MEQLKRVVEAVREQERSSKQQLLGALQAATPQLRLELPRIDPQSEPAGSASAAPDGWAQLKDEAMEAGEAAEAAKDGVLRQAEAAAAAGEAARRQAEAAAEAARRQAAAGVGAAGGQLEEMRTRVEGAVRAGVASLQRAPTTLADKARLWAVSTLSTLATTALLALSLAATGAFGPLANAMVAVGATLLPTARAWAAGVTAWLELCGAHFATAGEAVSDGMELVDSKVMAPLHAMEKSVAEANASLAAGLQRARDAVGQPVARLLAVEPPLPDAAELKRPIAEARAAVDAAVAALDQQVAALSEEFKPQVQKINEFEDAVQLVDPTFDVPDPEDLKRHFGTACVAPARQTVAEAEEKLDARLEEAFGKIGRLAGQVSAARDKLRGGAEAAEGGAAGAEAMGGALSKAVLQVGGALEAAKATVGRAYEEVVGSTPVGAVVHSPLARGALVGVPIGALFLLNGSVALSLAFGEMASGARAGLDAAVNGSTLPALELGVNLTAPPLPDWGDAALAVNFSQPSFEWQSNFSSVGTGAFEEAQFNWRPYFVPSFSQIFMSIVQLLLVHFGLRKSSIINAMNCQIASLEKRMNDELNAVISRSVGGVLDETVKHETARAEEVFSQAEGKIDQLESTVQTLTDVESYTAEIEKVKAAVQGEAKEMVSGVDTVLKSGVEQIAKQKEEMQARIQRAYAAAVAAEAALKGDPKAAAKAAAGAASSAASRLRKSFNF